MTADLNFRSWRKRAWRGIGHGDRGWSAVCGLLGHRMGGGGGIASRRHAGHCGSLLRCRNSRRSIGSAWTGCEECSSQASDTMGMRSVSCSGRGDHAQGLCPHGAGCGHKQSHPTTSQHEFLCEAMIAVRTNHELLELDTPCISVQQVQVTKAAQTAAIASICGWCPLWRKSWATSFSDWLPWHETIRSQQSRGRNCSPMQLLMQTSSHHMPSQTQTMNVFEVLRVQATQ